MLSFAQIASLATRIILSVFLINETPRVKSELVNVAIGKSTSQSGEKWPSRNAVDGQMECMNVDEQHFTLTNYSHLPWWEVNLGDQFKIQEIIVHGRHDGNTNQLRGFRLYLSSSNQFSKNNIVYTNTDYNGGTISIALNLTGLFQFVKLDLPDTYRGHLDGDNKDKLTGPLVLCEVEVFVNMTNVAFGKPASMSSVYGGMAAGKSVDGNPRRDADHCSCCSHSMNEPNPWLKIDLLQAYKIFFITVIGRSDSNQGNRLLGGLNIQVDNSSILGSYNISNDSVVTVKFPVGITARNVTIARPKKEVDGEWFLVVCEVKIYTTDCQAGTYQDNKDGQCKSCGHCKNKPCNKDNGTCPGSVCIAGWSGDKCYTACKDGQYGENCLQNCSGHCLNGSSQCSKIDGKCQQGCILGFQGEKCASPCKDGQYGENCLQNCSGHCLNGSSQCSKIDGKCQQGCILGFQGEKCASPCKDGQYGENCLQNCSGHCLNGSSQCSKIDGKCQQGCILGFQGEKCASPCPHSMYGQTCAKRCNTCTQMTCRNTDGLCTIGCVPGYKPEKRYCTEGCDDGQFGQNCSKSCSGHCKHGNQQCNKTSGICMQGCVDGYIGDTCEDACPHSMYGQNCAKRCNTCTQMTCRNTDGLCTIGCVPGYKPEKRYCNEGCDVGQFGQNCSKSCSGHCKHGNQQCNKTSGICMQGCVDGYVGDTCEDECPPSKYGENCTLICSNCEGLSCNNTDGFCLNGCVPGYIVDDPYCNTKCPASKYGKNCSQICSTCEDMLCNNTNGLCVNRCVPGYTFDDLYCNTTCPASTFGRNCSRICSTCKDMSCNNTDGSCSIGCVPGYKFEDLSCNTPCDNGSYGRNCSSSCSGNCLGGNEQCDTINGTCMQECDRGFFGDKCAQECPQRKYGYNCNETCHLCKNGTVCNFTNGNCPEGCSPGYNGKKCDQACRNGYFGDCTHSCHCSDGMPCSKTDGFCRKGCDFGWDGYNCSLNQNLILQLSHVVTKQTGVLKNYNSSKAIDGEENYDVENCNCCSVTNGTVTSWWQIDLGHKYLIDAVRIHGRKDTAGSDYQLKNAVIYASNHTMVYNNSTKELIYRIPKTSTSVLTRHLITATIAQFFIVKSDQKSFALCEFELFEKVCDVGRFGTGCNHTCHCSDNNVCDSVSGKCKGPGCFPGWSGESCNLELSMGSESHSAAIGGGIGTALALVIIGVIIGFIIHRRRNVKESSNKESQFSNLAKALNSRKQRLSDRHGSSMRGRENRSFEEEEETSMTQTGSGDYYSFGENFGGIKIYELWDCIKEKMENECEKFYSEFKRLPSGLVHPCKTADSIVNKGKNRYKEMYAYDHSRVVLDIEEGKNTDYINACYIDGYDKTKKFVASQGPTKQMIDDFWRMVWQLKSDKIVMLTDLVEMGTVKCLQYWPLEDEEEEHCFGKVIVKVLNTEQFLDYYIRLFEVRKNGESVRRIRQFHFKSWPDKDVPDSTWCLVNFWRAVNTNEPSAAGPIVVHCSAGVGRTGTFIALDNLVSQAKAEGCVRPLQVVQTLRRQRVNMVQTKEQYVYLHEALADALLFGTHYVFTKQFGEMFSFMLRKGKGETKSNLEKQFELIERSTINTTSAENVEYTNVETIQSESAAYRPKLKNRGSRFVQELGAMYIPNYKGRNTFLISMSPDKNTMEEFWSLVDDSHIKTIIMLTETSAACYQASAQLGANPKKHSKFSVNKIEEKIRKGFTERSFSFKESDREEEENLTTVKQFEYTDWKDGAAAPGDTKYMLDMINSVQKWQPHLSESQPILIHCSDGCKRSGIVCVLLNELQRIQYEGGLINILESVKMMKKRQKYLIPTYEQYRFCFELILAHSKTSEVYANL